MRSWTLLGCKPVIKDRVFIDILLTFLNKSAYIKEMSNLAALQMPVMKCAMLHSLCTSDKKVSWIDICIPPNFFRCVAAGSAGSTELPSLAGIFRKVQLRLQNSMSRPAFHLHVSSYILLYASFCFLTCISLPMASNTTANGTIAAAQMEEVLLSTKE